MPGVDPVQNPMGALQQLAADPMRTMLQQQTEGYERSKGQLEKLQRSAARAPELDETERWASMAQAAAQTPPMVGGFGALLANIGGAYGKTLSAQEQRNFEREAAIAKMMEQQGGGLGSGSMTALTQAMLNPIMNIGGVGVNRMTGQMVVPKALEGTYSKLFSDFYKQAVEQKMPNPEQWAQTQARSTIEQQILANPSIAGSTYGQRAGVAPLPSQGGMPQVSAQQGEPSTPMPRVDLAAPGTPGITRDASSWLTKLKSDEAEAVRAGDYARALEVQKARQALEANQPAEPSPLQYRDIPKAEMEKSQAGEAGKRLQKEAEALNAAASASAELKMQLGQLSELFKTPDLPEGRFGEQLQGIRSGLASLGFLDKDQEKTVGAGDLVSAIGGKLALLTRTADGGNLMPGQMSDFEQRILRSLAPGLGQTSEGRAALVDFLNDMASVRIRLSEEANKLTDDRGILSPEWFKRKGRLLKEEQARMAVRARELQQRFGGKK